MNHRTLTMTNLLNLTHTTVPGACFAPVRDYPDHPVRCGAEGLLTRLGCHSFRATGITSICLTAASSSTRSRSAAPLFVPRHVGRRESSAVYSPGGADFKLELPRPDGAI